MPDQSDSWTYLCHLPGLSMAEDERAFAAGSLRRISHDDWHRLDESAWQPVDYADCNPLFYCITVSGNRGEFGMLGSPVWELCRAEREKAYRALALVLGWPLLPPASLSCGYLLEASEDRAQNYTVGPSGRDWILTGQYRTPRHTVTDELIDGAETVFDLLSRAGERLPGTVVEAGLRAFELAALPETSETFGPARYELPFLGAVAAIEPIVVPPPGTAGAQGSITQTFARHTAILVANDFDQAETLTEQFRLVYKLRSDLMHGRVAIDRDNETQGAIIALGCGAFPLVLQNALMLLAGGIRADEIASLLERRSTSRTAFEAQIGIGNRP